jgi:hypothetical protein
MVARLRKAYVAIGAEIEDEFEDEDDYREESPNVQSLDFRGRLA